MTKLWYIDVIIFNLRDFLEQNELLLLINLNQKLMQFKLTEDFSISI